MNIFRIVNDYGNIFITLLFVIIAIWGRARHNKMEKRFIAHLIELEKRNTQLARENARLKKTLDLKLPGKKVKSF